MLFGGHVNLPTMSSMCIGETETPNLLKMERSFSKQFLSTYNVPGTVFEVRDTNMIRHNPSLQMLHSLEARWGWGLVRRGQTGTDVCHIGL